MAEFILGVIVGTTIGIGIMCVLAVSGEEK